MQPRAIDHVVWAVDDLDLAAKAAQSVGFTTTNRAQHPPHMGTTNRLIQFRTHNFIEFLEVDRPAGIAPHSAGQLFSFGAFSQDFLQSRSGMSMIVFDTNDANSDALEFERLRLGDTPCFDFGRQATSPDGTIKDVAFRLAFAIDKTDPTIACFTCQNRFPENFWKAEFQHHENGAAGIRQVIVAADAPERVARYLAGVARSVAEDVDGHWLVPCAKGQSILVKSRARSILGRTDRVPDHLIHATEILAVVVEGVANGRLSDRAWGGSEIELVTGPFAT